VSNPNTNSASNGHGTCTDDLTLLELFMLAPEFEDFKKLLRKAAHVLTVADFVRLRKSYVTRPGSTSSPSCNTTEGQRICCPHYPREGTPQ
jgi:hypothetical protein